MNSALISIREAWLRAARAAGFDLAGIAAIDSLPRRGAFAQWLAEGRAGEMAWLARRLGEPVPDAPLLREDIRHVFPWARSVLCCAVNYNSPAPRSIDARDPARGWISRYAWGDDYHPLLRGKLDALAGELRRLAGSVEVRISVDTSPIVEREPALAAGLGWQGKNTCLIHPRLGSWLFLGCLITSLELPPDHPLPDRCGSCRRCIDACPTGALDTPYRMDASRCIAYLNLELRGPIPIDLRSQMGNQLIGCDICQDVCPWNRKSPLSFAPAFQPRPALLNPSLSDLASLDPAGYRELFRHSAAKRAKYGGLLRNLAVAMGNSGLRSFIPVLRRLARHDDALVREHAVWALQRLGDDADGTEDANQSPAQTTNAGPARLSGAGPDPEPAG